MRINIIAVGTIKEHYFQSAINEYLKRLPPYATVSIMEVAEERPSSSYSRTPDSKVLLREGERILKAIPAGSQVIVLDSAGTARTSTELANWIESLRLNGQSHLSFIIGGSNGVSSQVKDVATEVISFGPVTFPHQLVRIVLLEQLYRAFKILRNEPYHK